MTAKAASAEIVNARPIPGVDSVAPRRPKARVLVVEDHDETRDVVAMLLKTDGYDVVVAEDGDAGLKAARECHPQIAIIDIFLPRKDGVAVIEQLVREQPSLVIVAVSADTSEDRRGALIRARAAGAHWTLRKPLEPWVLLKALGQAAGVAQGPPASWR